MANEVFIYLDEGALDGDESIPSVAAVALQHPSTAREAINELQRRLLLDTSFRLETNASRFQRDGFHHTYDPLTAQLKLIEAMKEMTFNWYCSSLLGPRPKKLYSTIEKQYVHLVRTVVHHYKDHKIHLTFEQNTSLNKKFRSIVERAMASLDKKDARVQFSIAGKEERLLSLPDYCIAISAAAIRRWRAACCDLSEISADHEFRTFAGLESKCSFLYAYDSAAVISNRSGRLETRTYSSISKGHHPACPVAQETELC